MYLAGHGVPQDVVRALMWFNLAAAQGAPEEIENRNRIVPLLTPAEIAEAQKLAREWRPTKKPCSDDHGC